MAAARDQAARVLRAEAENAEGGSDAAGREGLGEALRTHVAEETKRRPADAPAEKPAAAPGAPAKRRAGWGPRRNRASANLSCSASSRCLRSQPPPMDRLLSAGRPLLHLDRRRLCARQQHHAGRARRRPHHGDSPGDNALVKKGEVILRIDDGDYRIAVDAAKTKIATQEATIARIGRQVNAQVSAVEQAEANLASAEAGLEARRPRL